jgi:hypothetical protein
MNKNSDGKFSILRRQKFEREWFSLKDQIKDFIIKNVEDTDKAYKALIKLEEVLEKQNTNS